MLNNGCRDHILVDCCMAHHTHLECHEAVLEQAVQRLAGVLWRQHGQVCNLLLLQLLLVFQQPEYAQTCLDQAMPTKLHT